MTVFFTCLASGLKINTDLAIVFLPAWKINMMPKSFPDIMIVINTKYADKAQYYKTCTSTQVRKSLTLVVLSDEEDGQVIIKSPRVSLNFIR